MMSDKNKPGNEDELENELVKREDNHDSASPKVPNPFEKGHADLSQEALDNLEQFKEAQTERD